MFIDFDHSRIPSYLEFATTKAPITLSPWGRPEQALRNPLLCPKDLVDHSMEQSTAILLSSLRVLVQANHTPPLWHLILMSTQNHLWSPKEYVSAPRGGYTYRCCTYSCDRGQDFWPSKISLDLLTAPDLCPWPFDPSLMRMRKRHIDVSWPFTV